MVNFEKENSKIKKLIGLFLVCVLVLLYALFIYQVDEQESSNRDFLIVVSFFLACICQYFVVKSMRKLIAYKGITDDDKSMSTNDELSSPKTSTSDFKEEFGDVVYAILSLSNEIQISAEECLSISLEKMKKRMEEKNSFGSGR